MTPTCYFRCAVASILVAVVLGKIVSTTDANDDVNPELPSLSESPSTTSGYSRKHLANWFDDYEDSDDDDVDDEVDDDGQYYDDETEDLQSDYHRGPFLSGYTTNTDNLQPSKKVQQFWSNYRPNHRTRTHHGANEDPKGQEDVRKHHERVKAEYQCKIPQPRVVKALDHHPSTTKTYVPTCTVLHQCAESTGCCPANERCGPKKTEKLELTFYALVNAHGLNPHYTRRVAKIEKLIFYNHTECECQVRSDEMPRDVLPTPDPPEASPFSKCQCPAPFNLRLLPGAECACDCFDKQRDCLKYKKGKDYLNHEDRLCIEMRKCLTPLCDYGNYIRRSGRCPRKDEKFRY